MKVYIITETSENIIRCATLRKDVAENILESFGFLGLEIHEHELIGIEL